MLLLVGSAGPATGLPQFNVSKFSALPGEPGLHEGVAEVQVRDVVLDDAVDGRRPAEEGSTLLLGLRKILLVLTLSFISLLSCVVLWMWHSRPRRYPP